MQTKSYKTSIEVDRSPEVVFNHITQVSKWWSKDFEGSSASLNHEFVICHPCRHYSTQKLIEFVRNKKVVWLVTDSRLDWLEGDKHEWTNTKVIFELALRGNKTVSRFYARRTCN